MSIDKRRNEFREWARATVQNNTTIDGYMESLEKNIPEYLNMESIFSIDNVDEINALHSRCGIGGDLYEFSRNIGNGRPQASLGKYKKYLQYSYVNQVMQEYELNPDNFHLNGAHVYFKVSTKKIKYPVKAICRQVISSLGLPDNFTTDQAKATLKSIFPQNTIEFFDTNTQENVTKDNLEDKKSTMNNNIKNIILYGSPGVGKTHNTKKLISLIESRISEKEIFETITNNEVNNGIEVDDIKDRVRFVTFHQSFGYEDFIEGFRPNEEGNIELEKGIFLKICKEAEENLLKSGEVIVMPFSDAFKILFKEKIENEESVTIDLKRVGSYFNVNDYNDRTIYFEKQSGTTKHTLSIATLEKMYNEEKNSSINGGLAVYYEPILEKLLQIKRKSIVDKIERKNYYLVIDEINRGNISKIFGELITLIEEDKRDTLEVTLPYSKQTFKIPSNLYIIGTMNSTDKSIALIDIALRRRFTFLKMEPKTDLVSHVKAQNIMIQLNEKITNTLGADYVLGHSYFMKIENDDDLAFVLEYKVIPLLEEYYYGDTQGLKNILEIINE